MLYLSLRLLDDEGPGVQVVGVRLEPGGRRPEPSGVHSGLVVGVAESISVSEIEKSAK